MRPVCIVTGAPSNGSKLLAHSLKNAGIVVVRSSRPRENHLNVGWGSPSGAGGLNQKLPPNKLWELQQVHKAGHNAIPFSINANDLVSSNQPIWGRMLKHSRGTDIVIVSPTTDSSGCVGLPKLPQRDFWTLGIPKVREYRIHVFQGLAVRCGAKRKETGEFEDKTQPIWNLDHGFQIRYEEHVPGGAKELAKAAMKACKLDFGAVDIIHGKNGIFYFLEVNTRPGLHGNTAVKYANKIAQLAKES